MAAKGINLIPKKNIISLAAVIVLAAIAATYLANNRSPAPENLVIADAAQQMFALLYVAEAKGFFADEGLEVSYQKFTSGRDALSSVINGDSDVATVYETPIVLNSGKGHRVRVLSTLHTSNKNTALIARRDRGIETPADLKGKRIGVSPNTNGEFFLLQFLVNEGVAPDSVELVNVNPQDMVMSLTKGHVDAIATWNPHLFTARNKFPADAVVAFSSSAYTEMSVLAVREETVTEKKEALLRLLRAVVRAEKFVSTNESEAINITVRRLSDQTEETIRAVWKDFRAKARLDNILLSILTQEAEWFAERGIIPRPIPNFRDVLFPAYLDGISPESVTVRYKGDQAGNR